MRQLTGAFASALLAVMSIGGAAVTQAAETETTTLIQQANQTDTLTSTRGDAAVSGRISNDFRTFSGSTSNANALVAGLRNGTPITLTSTNASGNTTSSTFTAPTGKMGYGNVFITMSLAQQQLANAGITQPTTQQIQASLLGGTVTNAAGQTVTLQGVAQMRSDGMGWGQISNTLGFKLGPVVSGIKAANAGVAAAPATTTPAASAGASAASSGIVTGTGGAAASTAGNGQGNAYGRGIVNAAGGTVGPGGAAGAGGQGNAYGHGMVSGAGNRGGGGNAMGHGKGK